MEKSVFYRRNCCAPAPRRGAGTLTHTP